uniref:F-box protein n=1 Tax=Noccaea caerulescens TaxID=107243 RepID=A0A1J3FA62_NOCCA
MDSDSVPSELITEVLSRLPPKSIAKFHCVSELWASLFGGAHFTELFLTRRSSAQPPRILFAIEKHGLWNVFSMPQRLRPYEKPSPSPSPPPSPSSSSSSSSSPIASASAEFHMSFPPDNMRIYPLCSRRFSFGYAFGLMYFYGMWVKEEDYYGFPVVCNPNTGRYETLPFLERYRTTSSFFGFDPIGKQYKVLFMAYPSGPDRHKVITLGSGETKWRTIECPLMHENASDGICINGVVYYLGDLGRKMTDFVIVCFDVRSETFEFIYPEGCCQLINYLGKLGLVFYDDYDGDAVEFRVWVLEDFDKQEWSKYDYTLRDDKFLSRYVSVVGVTVTGEIVLSMADYTAKQPFYVFYLNPEWKSLQCVEIKGFGEYYDAIACPVSRVHVFVEDCSRFYAFADQVEDLTVNDPKLLKSSIYVPYPKPESDNEDQNQDQDQGEGEGEGDGDGDGGKRGEGDS